MRDEIYCESSCSCMTSKYELMLKKMNVKEVICKKWEFFESFKFLFKMHQSRRKYFMKYVSSFSTLLTILSEILHKIFQIPLTFDFDHHLLRRVNILSLREKCPYSEFFRSVFSRIRT